MSGRHADRRDYFRSLYGQGEGDPYGVRVRWYEQRKQAVALACLTRPHYRSIFEPACGIGELSLALAARGDYLLATDFDAGALDTARSRAGHLTHVQFEQGSLPQDFPLAQAPFDLIVISELGYFLDESELHELAARCRRSLAADGTLLACHWLADFEQRSLPTARVHQILGGDLVATVRHLEADFELVVWSADGVSVATAEGIR